jgi:hypothetical protein
MFRGLFTVSVAALLLFFGGALQAQAAKPRSRMFTYRSDFVREMQHSVTVYLGESGDRRNSPANSRRVRPTQRLRADPALHLRTFVFSLSIIGGRSNRPGFGLYEYRRDFMDTTIRMGLDVSP